MNSYLVFFVISYCSIFAFFMNFDDISYLINYPSLYESSFTGNCGLLSENQTVFSDHQPLNVNFTYNFSTSAPAVENSYKQRDETCISSDSNAFVLWEDYKWSFLYYISLFLIPATLTWLYFSPNFVKDLDFFTLFIYLGLIGFAFIANNDTKWLLEWGKKVSLNSVSLNGKMNVVNHTLHSAINNTITSLNHNISNLDSKIDFNVTVLDDNIISVNKTLGLKINSAITDLNNSIIDIENKMVLKTDHDRVVADLKSDYNSKIQDLKTKILVMESESSKRKRRSQAVSLGAAGSDISLGLTQSLFLRQHSFSFLVWINIESFQSNNNIIACKEGIYHKYNQCLHFILRDRKPYFGFYDNDFSSDSQLQTRTWTHLAFVYDAQQKMGSIFINGKKKAQRLDMESLEGDHPVYISVAGNGRELNGRLVLSHLSFLWFYFFNLEFPTLDFFVALYWNKKWRL
jgi:hypothetical protein